MNLIISIVLNAFILFLLEYFLSWNESLWIKPWVIVEGWVLAYTFWGIILWIINSTIKPILKVLSLPFFFLFFWLTSIIINLATLWLLQFLLNDFLMIEWISYKINSWFDFIVAVAIFSILNIIYSLILNK